MGFSCTFVCWLLFCNAFVSPTDAKWMAQNRLSTKIESRADVFSICFLWPNSHSSANPSRAFFYRWKNALRKSVLLLLKWWSLHIECALHAVIIRYLVDIDHVISFANVRSEALHAWMHSANRTDQTHATIVMAQRCSKQTTNPLQKKSNSVDHTQAANTQRHHLWFVLPSQTVCLALFCLILFVIRSLLLNQQTRRLVVNVWNSSNITTLR